MLKLKPIATTALAAFLAMLSAAPALAQTITTNITPANVTVNVNSTVDLSLKVTNFTNITTFQCPIKYDATVLEYLSTDGFGIADMTAANVANPKTPAPRVTISYLTNFGQNPNGITLPTNTVLMVMHFKVLANGTSTVNLASGVQPTIEAYNKDGVEIAVAFATGGAKVTGGNGNGGGGNPPAVGFQIRAKQDTVAPGVNFCMPIKVNDFNNITTFQYATHWDKNVLQFTGTQDYNLSGLDGSAFGINNAQTTGTITVGWIDPATTGVTKPNGTAIYSVCFKAIGAEGTSSDVYFDGVGFGQGAGGAEAWNAANKQVWDANSNQKAAVVVKKTTVIDPPPNGTDLTFKLDTVQGKTGDTICVAMKVKNFKKVESIQLGFTFDPLQLKFTKFDYGGNPLGLTGGSLIGPSTGSPGTVKMGWISPSGTGVDLVDGTTLFSACFVILAPTGTNSVLDIKNLPNFDIEVTTSTSNGQGVTVVSQDGMVQVKVPPPTPCNVTVNVDNITHVKCYGGQNGAINTTATGNTQTQYSYSWTGPNNFTNTQGDLSGLKAGIYNLTVTNPSYGGCTATATAIVNEPTKIEVPTVTPTGTSCSYSTDGSIVITVTGGTSPYTFKWSATPGSYTSTQQNISNLAGGNYSVVITDANQCSLTSAQILVAKPQPLDVPAANIAVANVKCFGGSDGQINITTATGGTAPYTYTWSSASLPSVTQNPPLTNLPAAAYTVSVTDSKGCTIIKSVVVVGPSSAPAFQVNTTSDIKCFNDENGIITTAIIGGTQPYVYSWKNAAGTVVSTVQNPQNLAAGTYSCTVTDNNGCTTYLFNPAEIKGPSSPLQASYGNIVDVKCFGGTDGSIAVNAQGGWPGGKTVAWSNGATGLFIQGLPPGFYSATVTDSKGCSISLQQVEVKGPHDPISFTNTVVTQITCHGQGNGKIVTTVVGGTPPYKSVNWSPSGGGMSIENLGPGTYVATVTDNNNCTAVQQSITVTEPTVLTATPHVVDQNGPKPGKVSLTVGGGTVPYTYKWDPATSTTDTISGNAGIYKYTVTDANGCSVFGQTPMANSLPILAVTGTSKGDCGGSGCVKLKFSVSNATNAITPYIIHWTPGSAGATGVTTDKDSVDICGLPGGTIYTFTITAAVAGVLATVTVPVQSFLPVSHNSDLSQPIEDSKSGSIDLKVLFSGQTYSYLWYLPGGGTANTQDLTKLDSGTYIVLITDLGTGCSDLDTFHLTRQYKPLKFSTTTLQRPNCVDSDNGKISHIVEGGTHIYFFHWSGPGVTPTDTMATLDQLPTGIYNLTVTDQLGASVTGTWSLLPQSTLSASFAKTPGPNGWDISGAGICDGEIKVSANGQVNPLHYTWSDGSNAAKNSALCAGDWQCIVSDGAGCADTLSGSLTGPAALALNVTTSDFNGFNVKCFGGHEGEAAISVNGGVAPYSVKWSTGYSQTLATSSELSQQKGLSAGMYTVSITDANGILTQKVVEIIQPDTMKINIDSKRPDRFTECNGTMLAVISNAADPINFHWAAKVQNGTTQLAEGLCAGEKVTWFAQDANGCQASTTVKMEYPFDGCLLFSPVLTPGRQDGKNDFLLITCVESVPDNKLDIYNRWGQLIFSAKGYDNEQNTWKGTNDFDQALPDGVYFYIFEFTNQFGEKEQRKGYINLLR